ncbi:hypothetical protein LguiB_011391 [Lonicera macranthoides]
MGKKEKESRKENKEGKNLLGQPTFKKMENGRLKCVETGHELPEQSMESYAESKHCRLGLIDSALSLHKPPLNIFLQDPLSRSKLVCKLTGVSINKSEEHIWKHINGKKFLNLLEKKEAEKEMANGTEGEKSDQKPDQVLKSKDNGLKKKKKVEKNIKEVISEIRNSFDKDSDSEEDNFWVPPEGDRWDFDDGGDRWCSDSESALETDENSEADGAGEEVNKDAVELSKRYNLLDEANVHRNWTQRLCFKEEEEENDSRIIRVIFNGLSNSRLK